MSPLTHCKFVHSMQFLILDLGLGLQLLCNVVCTDVHFSAKVIVTLVPSLALGWLYPSDLDVLVEELSPLHNRWEELAHALSPSLDLEAIRARSHSGDGLHETMRRWLNTAVKHWSKVITALRKVGEDDVANKLKVKYGELATTVVSLTLHVVAWVTVVWNLFGWEECNSTQLHLALLQTSQLKSCASIPKHNSYYLAFFPDPPPV